MVLTRSMAKKIKSYRNYYLLNPQNINQKHSSCCIVVLKHTKLKDTPPGIRFLKYRLSKHKLQKY